MKAVYWWKLFIDESCLLILKVKIVLEVIACDVSPVAMFYFFTSFRRLTHSFVHIECNSNKKSITSDICFIFLGKWYEQANVTGHGRCHRNNVPWVRCISPTNVTGREEARGGICNKQHLFYSKLTFMHWRTFNVIFIWTRAVSIG